jgi:hypothetical protein
MAAAHIKSFRTPDQVVPMEKGVIEVLNIDGGGVGRVTLQPGWKWSVHEKPVVAGGDFCEVPHFGYQASGTLHIVTREGEEFDTHAGDVVRLPPGHDGWVVGDETVVLVDFATLIKQG